MTPRLHLIVPCFDEEHRLPLPDVKASLDRLSDLALTFVDDGSHDRTADVLEGLVRERPGRVGLVRLEKNVGKAEAVRAGILPAFSEGSAYVGYWDADLAAPFESAFDLVDDLERRPGLLLAMGSRLRTRENRIERRAFRHYPGRVVAKAISRTLGLPVYDTQCGAKVFRVTEATRAVFEEPFETRWLFDVEILARLIRLHRQGLVAPPEETVFEHPLPYWHDVPGSKVRAREFFRSFFALRRIRRRYGCP